MRGLRARAPAALLLVLCLLSAVSGPAAAQDAAGLTIEQASQLAQSGSEAIRIRDLAVRKARLAQQEAEAQLWPHLDLQATGSYLANPPTGYTVTRGSLGVLPAPFNLPLPTSDLNIGAQPYDYITGALTLTQPLFTWGKIRSAIDAAALQVQSAGTDLAAQRRDIEREVSRAYFSALLAQESQKVLAALSGTAADIVADRQAALEAGTGTREAVLEAQSRKAQVDARLVEARQSEATARETLGMLTGLDPDGIHLASGFRDRMPDLDEPALRARVEEDSTDVSASRLRQGQAQKKLALEQGGALLRPDLALGLSLSATGAQNYFVLNGTPPNSTTSTSWTWDLVISLSVKMSVFDGSGSAARIGQAEQDVQAAGQALAQSRKLARLALRQGVEAALKAQAELENKLAAERYADEREKNARAGFDSGMASRGELRAAEIASGSAALDRLLAQFTREEALADIAHLTGEPL
ncbi:MAG TPA: TolC family protein [Spirochaetia bacterium]|nr:TolC family protein [Spirochaetia bacterium]